ncbi:MAG: hypothetical protein ACYDC0_16240 [Acidimicrobiales bacterium]
MVLAVLSVALLGGEGGPYSGVVVGATASLVVSGSGSAGAEFGAGVA